MKRSWLNLVAAFVLVAFGAIGTSALAAPGGGLPGGGSSRSAGASHVARAPSFNSVRQTGFNSPLSKNVSPVKVARPIGGGGLPPLKPTTPTFPVGPIKPPGGPVVGPIKPPIGPIGPIKPPGGPVVGPVKPPIGPIGPIGPIKPPGGPVVGPIKPPIGPIGPIGPIKPPGGGGGSQPPGGGGGGQPPSGGGNTGHCKPCWPPIVLGCLPCVGGHYGGYYPPVYTQTVVVPAAAPVVVAEAAPATPVATTEAAAPVEVAADKLPQVPVGSTLTLQAKDLGLASGQVLLVMDKVTLGVQVNEWNNDYATATLPLVGITGLTKSEIVLVRADGHPASSVKVELVPAQPQSGG